MGLLSLAPDFSNDSNLHFFKITDKKSILEKKKIIKFIYFFYFFLKVA